jgi:hypothetical protein
VVHFVRVLPGHLPDIAGRVAGGDHVVEVGKDFTVARDGFMFLRRGDSPDDIALGRAEKHHRVASSPAIAIECVQHVQCLTTADPLMSEKTSFGCNAHSSIRGGSTSTHRVASD